MKSNLSICEIVAETGQIFKPSRLIVSYLQKYVIATETPGSIIALIPLLFHLF